MVEQIVLASGNRGKIRELSELLQGKVKIIPQGDFNISDPDETGLSFVENAIIKARNACRHAKLPAIADDSGIEVDALAGAPGIYSARYGGENATNEDNINKLLSALQADSQRAARFQCVMVFMRHELDPSPVIAQGTWEGEILTKPAGAGGFGYDPVFFVAEKNCSAAQLGRQEKNSLSHRGKALKKLIRRLGWDR